MKNRLKIFFLLVILSVILTGCKDKGKIEIDYEVKICEDRSDDCVPSKLDDFPTNRAAYVHVYTTITNSTEENQKINAKIEVVDNTDITVNVKESGSSENYNEDQINLTGVQVGSKYVIEGIMYSINEDESEKVVHLVFMVLASDATDLKLRFEYDNEFIESDIPKDLNYSFIDETNLDALADPNIYISNGKVVWDEILGSNGYYVEINDTIIERQYERTVDLSGYESGITIKVKALAEGHEYKDSNMVEFVVTKLPKPIVNFSKEGIDWNENIDASSSSVFIDDLEVTMSETNYSFIDNELLTPGEHIIKVKYNSVSDLFIDSSYSDLISIVVLEAVELVDAGMLSTTVTWECNVDADYYDVYVNNELYEQTTECSFEKVVVTVGVVNNDVYVIARSNDEKVLDSKKSNTVTYLLF